MLLYMRTGKLKEDTIPQRLKHALRVSIMKKNDRIIQIAGKKGLKDAFRQIKTTLQHTQ